MSLADLGLSDLIGVFLGFSLTLMIFTYLLGDNFFFRLAIHIFIGVSAGIAVLMAFYNVLLPQLFLPLISGERGEFLLALIFLVPSALLLTKISPRLARLGNPVMAFLVGVGAAAAIGGAVRGTLFPQTVASLSIFEFQNAQVSTTPSWQRFINAVLILLGTLTTLIYFHFSTRSRDNRSSQRANWIEGIGWIGQGYIAITFGALFVGVYIASLTALIERVRFLWDFVVGFIGLLLTS
ncbi:MAG: hypothetical protein PVG14_12560 [Anaerolineales bacterium]|jgi:hypothetical protein